VISETPNILERHLATLRHLSNSLRDCQKAIVDLDLEEIQFQVKRQETLCSEIRFLELELKQALRSCAGADGAPALAENQVEGSAYDQEKPGHLYHELSEALEQVRYSNHVQGQVLRKSRRSLNVLINFLAQYHGNYSHIMSAGIRFAVGMQGR
jgi:flagellar biosynthesis/type III secretory pathway chaperone